MVALKWLGPTGAAHARAGRGRHHGRELPALPAAPLQASTRSSARRAAPETRDAFAAQMVEAAGHPGAAARHHRGGRAQRRHRHRLHHAHRHRQPRAVGASAARPSSLWRGARWTPPAGRSFDKVVIDDWDCNMTVREFRDMIDAGEFRPRAAARRYRRGGRRAASPAASATTSASSSTPPAWCRTTSASAGGSTRRRRRKGWAFALPTAVAQQAFGPQD